MSVKIIKLIVLMFIISSCNKASYTPPSIACLRTVDFLVAQDAINRDKVTPEDLLDFCRSFE